MDYTKVPRGLIYKERNDLKEFGVQIPETMNYLLFLRLKQQALMGAPCAREIALRCYNNAYYVCTLILLEADDFPELRISDYVDKILEIEKGKRHIDEVCLASMAMACLLLATYDPQRYGRDSEIWNAIYHRCTHQQWYHSPATDIFHHMMEWDFRITTPLSHRDFDPRDIIEVIENCSEGDLQVYVEYICERLALLKDQRQQMRGADMAIVRIKDNQREFCENSGYNPMKDRFKYEDNSCYVIDPILDKEIRDYYQQGNEAINCYTKYYPTKEDENDSKENAVESPQTPDTEVLQTKIRELESKITHQEMELIEAKNINSQQATRIKELEAEVESVQNELEEAHTIPDTVTAQQRVRMELARKLMDAAGIDEEILAKWGNKDKAGTLMGTMLDIIPSTCKTYLSDPCMNYEHHKDTVDKINPLLEALDLEFEL